MLTLQLFSFRNNIFLTIPAPIPDEEKKLT